MYEGGVRVPFVVKWPAKLPAGVTFDRPVSSLDVFATSLAAAGATMPTDRKYDSVNLIPYLSGGDKKAPHDQLYWRTTNRTWAIRAGDSKLVRMGNNPDKLFNLPSDIGETSDLHATHPAAARRLAAALNAWDQELVPPAFPGATGPSQKKAQAN